MVETEELAVPLSMVDLEAALLQVLWHTQVVSRCLSSPQVPQSVWEVVELLVMRVTVVTVVMHALLGLVAVGAVRQEGFCQHLGAPLKSLGMAAVGVALEFLAKAPAVLQVGHLELVEVVVQMEAHTTHHRTQEQRAAPMAAVAAAVVP